MIFELRTYWVTPGKIDNLHEQFRTLTLKLFNRYHMDVLGFWTPIPATSESGDLIYILCFPDENAKEAAWLKFRNDQEWIENNTALDKNCDIVVHITSITLQAIDYSDSINVQLGK